MIDTYNYQVSWAELPPSLRPIEPTTCDKVLQIAYLIVSIVIPIIGLIRLIGYGLKNLANTLILPAASVFSAKYAGELERALASGFNEHTLKRFYEFSYFDVTTPDGAILRASLFKYIEAVPQTQTLIHFSGNAALAVGTDSALFLQASLDAFSPTNFVTFDYRGVGLSQGTLNSPDDLMIDGASMVSWVKEKLKTPADKINFYGRSLGGAVALLTKASDTEHLTGKLISDRSFASLDKVLHALAGRVGDLLSAILKSAGFSLLDAASAFPTLTGKKVVFFHQNDDVIPYESSLCAAVNPEESLSLQIKEDSYIPELLNETHNLPLRECTDAFEKIRTVYYS